MQIPIQLQQAIAVLVQEAKDSLIDPINCVLTSRLYETAAVRWVQCIEHFMPKCPENETARQAEYKRVLPLYDSARGFLFKAFNESGTAVSLDVAKKSLEMEANSIALALEFNAATPAKIESTTINIMHIYHQLKKNPELSATVIGCLFLDCAKRMAELANIDRGLVRLMYGYAADSLAEHMAIEHLKIRNLRSKLLDDYPNIPKITKYLAAINKLWSLNASLIFALEEWETETVKIIPQPPSWFFSWASRTKIIKTDHLGLCKKLEALLSPEMQTAAELEMELFTAGYAMPGVESIESTQPKSTLRHRFRPV